MDNDQLWEALEAVQLETARREGAMSLHGSPQGSLQVPGVVGKLTWTMWKWPSEGEEWEHCETMQWPTSPPQATADVSQLLSTLTAGLRMGTLLSIP